MCFNARAFDRNVRAGALRAYHAAAPSHFCTYTDFLQLINDDADELRACVRGCRVDPRDGAEGG